MDPQKREEIMQMFRRDVASGNIGVKIKMPGENNSDELNDIPNYAPTSAYTTYDTGRRDEAGNPIMGNDFIDLTMAQSYAQPEEWSLSSIADSIYTKLRDSFYEGSTNPVKFEDSYRDVIDPPVSESVSGKDWLKGAMPEDFQASKLYADFFYGDDEKREQIKKAHDLTGIRAETIANDPEVWEKVMKIVQRAEKLKKTPGMLDANGDLNMQRVYEAMPYLREIVEKHGTNEAVMMLHNAEGLQTVSDAYSNEFMRFAGSVAAGAERGWYNLRKQLTYANAMVGRRKLTDAEREWVAYLDKQKEELPAYSYGGVGQAVGAMIGGAAENIPMIASAQGIGAVAGGITLALFKNPTAAAWVGRATAVAVMGLEIGGSQYEENLNKLDAKGRAMYTPTQAAAISATQGVVEGIIEQAALQKIARTIFGRGDAKTLRDIYVGAGAKDLTLAAEGVAANEAARTLIKDRILSAAKAGAITFNTELQEEFAQQTSDMIIENMAQMALKGDDAEISSVSKILQKSIAAAIEAAPSIMGFGLLGFGGHVGAHTNTMRGARAHMERLVKDRLYRSVNENQNLINTVEAVGDNLKNVQELQGKAPDLVNEMLDAQNRRYGMETTSVDIVSLNQEEGGAALVQEIAAANNISTEELQACADGTGMLPVKTSTLQQMTTNLDENKRKALFQNITKSSDLYTDKQVQHEAKIVKEILGAFREKTEVEVGDSVDRYVESAFAEHEHRALARDILLADVDHPGAEIRRRMNRLDADLAELMETVPNDERAEATERLAHIQPEIDKINAQKEALEAVTGTIKSLQPGDVVATAELSPEARGVYHELAGQLGAAKSRKARTAARASALLAARYADRMAKIYSEVKGEPYTAADYMRDHLSVDARVTQMDTEALHQEETVSSDQKLEEDTTAWGKQLDAFMSMPDKNSMRVYKIMETPLVFSLLNGQGFHVQLGRDIAISHAMLWKVLREKEVKGKSHGHALEMTPEIMKELPRALADPIMILRNRKGDDPHAPILPDEIVAVVDLQDKNGSTAIVPIVLKERNGKYMLKTFFGKDDVTWFQKRMMLGDILYAHKKRALNWVKAIQRHQSPGRFTLQGSFFNSIPTDTDLVKARADNEGFYQSAWHGKKESPVTAGPVFSKETLGTPPVGDSATRSIASKGQEGQEVLEQSAWHGSPYSKAVELERLRNTEPIVVPISVSEKQDGGKGIQNALDAFTALYPNGVDVPTRIGEVRVNRRSIKDSLTHFMYPAKFDTVTSLPEGLKIAAYIDSIPDVDGKDIMNHFLVYPIMYGGGKKYVVCRVREKFDVKKLYVHGVFSEEDIKKRGNALSQTQPPAERVQLRGTALYDSIIADFFNADNGKASFEQSAWHGSPYDFREFLLEMIGAGEMAAEKEAVRKQYEGTAQWMKAPNGETTNLTEDQWLTVRTPAFKEVFGDWEKASAAHEIHALIPVEVALSGKSLDKKTAEEVFSSFGEVENVRYGTYATFPKSMVGKIIKHKGLDVSQIIADIPHLFSSSVLAFVEPEYKREGHKEHPNILAYHHYVNKFKANEKTYYIRFSLREEKTKDKQKRNGKRILHSTGISDIEIYEDNKKDVSSQRIRVSDPGEESKTSFIDYRLADFFDSVKDCSKIVDENGEPLPSAISEAETLAQPAEEKRGAKGNITATLGGAQRLISLMEAADQSTFMHEMAHNFLFDLEHIAEIAPESRYAKDLAVIREWASWMKGAADEYAGTASAAEFRNREEKILAAEKKGDTAEVERLKREWMQERFARGFEEYLRSGEAPAQGLRAVFRRFKAWLTRIYKDVTGAGVRASAEVEAVMARMIATDEEIEAAAVIKRAQRLRKIDPELLDEDSAAKMMQWEAEAKQRAKETLLKELIREMQGRDVDAHMKDYEAQLKAEMRENPVWQAEAVAETFGMGQVIASGYYPTVEAYEKARKDAGGGYDAVYNRQMREERERYKTEMPNAEAIAQRAEEVLASQEYTARQTALEGELLNEYIKAYDNAPQRLKDAMIGVARALEREEEAPLEKAVTALKYAFRWQEKQAQEIEELRALVAATKEAGAEERAKMREKFGEALARLKLSAAQNIDAVRSLRDSAVGRVAAMRAYAQQHLETVPVHEATNARHWMRQTQNAAKEAERHLANMLRKNNGAEKEDTGDKDLAAARAAKTRQLAMEAMTYESIKLKRELDRMVKYFACREKNLANDKTAKIDGNHRYFIHHLMYVFGLRRSDGMPLMGDGAHSWSALMEELKNSNDGLDGVEIPDWLSSAATARDKQRKYTQLSMQELRDLRILIEFLYVTGRNKNTLLTSGENVDDVAARMYENYEKHIGLQDGGKEAHAYMVQLLKPETMLKVIGGKDGAIMHYFYNILFDAQEKKSEALEKNAKRLEAIIGQYYTPKERRQMSDKKIGIALTDGTELTKENVLSMALNWGNKGNRSRLVAGLSTKTSYTERDIEDIFEKTMTARDWAFVQEIWDYLNEHGDAVNEVVEKTTGSPMKRVAPDAFTIVDAWAGDTLNIRGGYYPIRYDPKRSDRAADQELATVAESVGGAMAFGSGMGSTKNRAKDAPLGRPLDLSLDVMYRHIDQQIHIATMRLACRDVYKLLNHAAVKEPVLQTFGKDAYDCLKRWCESTWQEPMNNNLYIETLAEEWRANTVTAIMAFRVSTAALNVANIAPMADRLGAVNAMRAMLLYLRHPQQIRRFVLNDSVFMRNRAHNMDRDLNTQGKNIFGGKTPFRKFLIQWGAAFMKETDMLCSVPTYYWTYRERYNKEVMDGADEIIARERAHREAHEAVRSIFGSSDAIDRSAVQRSQSGLVKAFTPFFSFFNAQMNAVWEKYYTGRYDQHKEHFVERYAAFVRSYLFRFVAMAAIETMIRQSLEAFSAGSGDKKDKDEWYKKFLKQWTANSLGSVTGGFPFLNAAGEVMQGAITGKLQQNRNGGVVFTAIGRFTDPIQMMSSMQSETSKIDALDFGRALTKAYLGTKHGVSDTLTDGFWNTARFMTDNYRLNNPDDLREFIAKTILDKKLKQK